MDLVLGILLMFVAGALTVTLSPMLMGVAVMGASDDPNNGWKEKSLGIAVIAAAILVPAALFFTGFYILF